MWAEETVITVATFKSADVVTASGYASTYGGDDWTISMGGNSKSIGFNNKNCTTIGDNLGTSATASNYGVVVKSKSSLKSVNRITFVYSGGSGDGGKLYLAYSANGTSWNAISLNTGEGLATQGVTVSQNTTFTFEFDTVDEAYYGFILDSGGTKTAAYRFDNVVVTFANVVVTADAALTAISVSGTYPTTFLQNDEFSKEGAVVTATYDDNSTKDVSESAIFSGYDMSQVGSQTVTVTYTENDVTKTASYEITISERPKYTVTLADDNTELTETTPGGGVTLPSRSDIGVYEFYGWSLTELTTATSTATVILSGNYNPSANITLYPVYTITSTKSIEEWVEIKAVPTDGMYAVCSDSYFMKAEVKSNRLDNGTATPSIKDGKLTVDPADDCVWNIYKVSDGSFRFKHDSKYFGAKSSNNQSALYDDETDTDNYTVWEITYSSGFSIANKGKTSKYLRNNGTYGWAPYNSDTGDAPRLFKKSQGTQSTYIYISNPVDKLSATVTSAGWATWVPSLNVEVPSGVSAYIVTATTATTATMTELLTVPAGTPILLKGAGTHTFDVIADEDILDDVTDNLLEVSDGTAKDDIYVLANGANGAGFYKWAGAALSAGRVYLPAPAGAREFIGFGDEATGIKDYTRETTTNNRCYNLNGQRVDAHQKGLYIVNGKKVIIK